MPKNKKRKKKRYTDEEIDAKEIEMEENDEYSSSEEEIVKVYENRKQRATRITKETVKDIKTNPKCRTVCFRYFLFVVVLSVGVAMVVQLYSTYGDYVTDAIFPPRTSSTGLVCANGTVENDYMLDWHGFTATENKTNTTEGWIALNATKPRDFLSLAWTVSTPPTLVPTRWHGDKLLEVWVPKFNECVSVLVYSV